MNIGENIRKFRLERGLTQEQLASTVGVSGQAVSKWECGESVPDAMLFVPVADALCVSLDRLCGREKRYEYDVFESVYLYVFGAEPDKQMTAAHEVCWQTQSALTRRHVINWSPDYGFKYAPAGQLEHEIHSRVIDERGFTFASNHAELPFFTVFPEPERGYGAALKYDERLREYFAALGDEYVLKAMMFLHAQDEMPFVFEKEVLAEACAIPDDRVENVLETLRTLNMLGGESWGIGEEFVINGETRTLYTSYPKQQFMATLILAYAAVHGSKWTTDMPVRRVAFLREIVGEQK